MNPFALSSLISASMVFSLGAYVYFKKPQIPVNRIFFLYCLTGAFWALSEFGYRQAESYQTALFWFKASSFSLPIVPLQLHFVLQFTESSNNLGKKWLLLAFYIPAVIFGALDFTSLEIYRLTKAPWGWTYDPIPGIVSSLFGYWFFAGFLLAFLLSLRHFLRAKKRRARYRAAYVTSAIGVILFSVFLSEPEGLFDMMGVTAPELTAYGFLMACLLLAYAIWKWELFSISVTTAAESILATMNDALFLVNQDGLIKMTNQASLDLLGYLSDELDYLPFESLVHSGSLEVYRKNLAVLLASAGTINDIEVDISKKSTGTIPVSLSASIVQDGAGVQRGVVLVAHDLTERKRSEELIKASLREKETLLREIHHRVKNNMQIVTSLLALQSRQLGDESAKIALHESRDRIQSMAIVHEMLYQSEGFSRIDFEAYASRLVGQICHAQSQYPVKVNLRMEIAPIQLAIDSAINCGLIITELVSNSFKHAFPGARTGWIDIEFEELQDHKMLLRVRDDGVGLPSGIDLHQSKTLGYQLVHILAEQLGGCVEIGQVAGAAISIVFENDH
jgi:PAS domain S-box-containing protein